MLSENYYENQIIKGEDFTLEGIMDKEFFDCTFENCDFTESNLSYTLFEDCTFMGCNLAVTDFTNARMRKVTFHECKISGVNFSKIDHFIIDLIFKNSNLNSCVFTEMNLSKNIFKDSNFNDCDFVDMNLSGVDFSGSSFKNSVFTSCDLQKANFQKATNYRINPSTNKVKGAIFSSPDVLGLLSDFGIKIK